MITLVVGPPTGGKSTWVRDHAQPGDVIVDFDTIAQTLGSPVTHDHPDHIVAITLEAHQAALRAIWRDDVGLTVWHVSANPRATVKYPYDKLVTCQPEWDVVAERLTLAQRPAGVWELARSWYTTTD